jgi:hypothetical protein
VQLRELEELNDAKRRYLHAKHEIDTLRRVIALKICPIKVGDLVRVMDDGKEYEGIVEDIDSGLADSESLGPVPDVAPGWSVRGHRIKKTDGTLSNWSFGFSNFNARLENGLWIITKRDLAAIFNIEV